MNYRLFSIFLLICFSQLVTAQKLHTGSKKAENHYQEAIKEYTLGNKIQAELLLAKAIKADKNFIEAYLFTGDIKAELDYPTDAIDFYEKGLQINPDYYPPTYFFMGKIFLKEGDYQKALVSFDQFLSYSNLREELKSEAELKKANCLFAIEAIKHPVQFQLKNLGQNINTKKSEYFPSLTVDNQFLLFTRRLDRVQQGEQEDFYGSLFGTDSTWQMSYPIYDINTPYNEGAASLSADGKTLVFTACENFGDYGKGRSGKGSCDLFFAKKRGAKWSNPVNMGPPINTANWESQPSLSSDGKTIYFIRAPKRSQGDSDIYRADLDENGYWGNPVKLGPTINTNGDEQSVFIHPDNKTLYFSSNGHVGMGGVDLYMSHWNEEKQEFGEAINLGFPINTYKDENSILVAPDGKLAYFASDRKDGFGELDLYSFELPEAIKPDPISYLKGIVYDQVSNELLGATFELIDLETGKQLIHSVSDPLDGSFLLTLNIAKDYMLNVSKTGYLFYSDQFLLEEETSTLHPFVKDIPLNPIAVGEKVVLKNIFFDTDESTLKENSKIELDKLIEFLNTNPNLHIEIEGHTDNVGSETYNLNLSKARAKAVYDFLIDHSILSDRLSYKGYGYTKPVTGNDTEQGKAQNRRTEFTITKM